MDDDPNIAADNDVPLFGDMNMTVAFNGISLNSLTSGTAIVCTLGIPTLFLNMIQKII